MGLIRLLLALSVLVEHSGPLLGADLLGGQLAVQAFFVVSGFYMAMILEQRYTSSSKDFFRMRALRIFPVYWCILAFTLAGSLALWMRSGATRAGALAPWLEGDTGPHGPAAWGLLALAIPGLVLQDTLLFLALDPAGGLVRFDSPHASQPLQRLLPIPPSWSLSLEIYFYLLAPWLVRRHLLTLALLATGSFAAKALLAHHGLEADPWGYRFFPTSLGYFLVGMLAWRIPSRHGIGIPSPLRAATWIFLAIAILLWRPAFPSAAFLAFLALSLHALFAYTKDWKWDRRLGELSYPLYLVHWPIFAATSAASVPIRIGASLMAAIFLQVTLIRWCEGLRSSFRTARA